MTERQAAREPLTQIAAALRRMGLAMTDYSAKKQAARLIELVPALDAARSTVPDRDDWTGWRYETCSMIGHPTGPHWHPPYLPAHPDRTITIPVANVEEWCRRVLADPEAIALRAAAHPAPDTAEGLRENPDAKALIDGWHLTNGAIDAMNAALSGSFSIYSDPEAGTDVDGDSVTVMDRLMDNGYVVASWRAIRTALRPITTAGVEPGLDVERLDEAWHRHISTDHEEGDEGGCLPALNCPEDIAAEYARLATSPSIEPDTGDTGEVEVRQVEGMDGWWFVVDGKPIRPAPIPDTGDKPENEES